MCMGTSSSGDGIALGSASGACIQMGQGDQDVRVNLSSRPIDGPERPAPPPKVSRRERGRGRGGVWGEGEGGGGREARGQEKTGGGGGERGLPYATLAPCRKKKYVSTAITEVVVRGRLHWPLAAVVVVRLLHYFIFLTLAPGPPSVHRLPAVVTCRAAHPFLCPLCAPPPLPPPRTPHLPCPAWEKHTVLQNNIQRNKR